MEENQMVETEATKEVEAVSEKKVEYWKQIIYVMTAGWVAIWVYRTALAPIYPEISAYFGGATDSQLGSISSFYFLGYVLMQIPSGLLVDRFGKKTILIPGFLLFGLGTMVVGLAQTLPVVYIGSVLAGVGCGTYYGVAYSLTAEHVPSSRKSLATAIVNSGTAVGSGIGMISSSYFVAQMGLPWQYMLFFTFFLIITMVFIFWKFIKGNKESEAIISHTQVIVDTPQEKTSFKALMRPQMVGAYCLYFATCYAYYLTDTWLPNFLSTERGFEGATIGLASSMVFFAAIPGALFFSRIADKFSHKKVSLIISLEIVAAIMLFLAVQAPNQVLLMVGLISYGFFGKLAVEPIIISWLGEHAPKRGIATTLGFFNFFGMSSSVIVPSLTGAISDATGSKVYAFYLSVIIIFVGTAIFYFVNGRKKKA